MCRIKSRCNLEETERYYYYCILTANGIVPCGSAIFSGKSPLSFLNLAQLRSILLWVVILCSLGKGRSFVEMHMSSRR
jgi:hypothetical protein